MTDIALTLTATILLAVSLWLLLVWQTQLSLPRLAGAAFSLGVGCLARADLLSVALVLTVVVALLGGRATRDKAEPEQSLAWGIAFAAPVAFLVGLGLLVAALDGAGAESIVGWAWLSAPGVAEAGLPTSLAPLSYLVPLAVAARALLRAARSGELAPPSNVHRATLLVSATLLALPLPALVNLLLAQRPIAVLDALPSVLLSAMLLASEVRGSHASGAASRIGRRQVGVVSPRAARLTGGGQ